MKMNTVQANGNYGIQSFWLDRVLFLKNVANENDADGIHVDDPGTRSRGIRPT